MSQANKRLPALLAAAGLLFSVVLEVVHVRTYLDPSTSSFCSAGASADCGTVALSPYSVLFNIPLPVWGIVGFTVMLVAAIRRSRMLLPLAGFAAVGSFALLGVSVFLVKSVCLLCEVVHMTSWALLYVAYKQRADLNPWTREEWINSGIAAAAVLGASNLFLPPYWALFSWRSGVHLPHGVEADGSRWIGAENPKVTVHEYADYGCPHCALAASRMRRLLARHPTSLRVVRHQYPRMSCPKVGAGGHACQGTRAALCAGEQGRFWEMDSWLFENAPGKVKLDVDRGIAEVALDGTKFRACFDDAKTFERADAADRAARRSRVIETPTYFIDGKRLNAQDAFAELRSRL